MNAQSLMMLGLTTALLGGAWGCGGSDTPTTPTTTTPKTPVAPTASEVFSSTLPVSGVRFFSFGVSQYGTVNLTLESVGGTGVPDTVSLGLGVGIPDATDCRTILSINTPAGSTPQVSTTLDPGTYCARVYDIGDLAATARFSVTIAHP